MVMGMSVIHTVGVCTFHSGACTLSVCYVEHSTVCVYTGAYIWVREALLVGFGLVCVRIGVSCSRGYVGLCGLCVRW